MVVPAKLVAIDGNRHGGGEERLGGRSDLEDGVRVDRLAVALGAHAETLRVGQPVAGDDADGDAGAVEILHPRFDIGFEIGRQRLDGRNGFGTRLRRARSRGRDDDRGNTDEKRQGAAQA
jgi:hypothetical protein